MISGAVERIGRKVLDGEEAVQVAQAAAAAAAREGLLVEPEVAL